MLGPLLRRAAALGQDLRRRSLGLGLVLGCDIRRLRPGLGQQGRVFGLAVLLNARGNLFNPVHVFGLPPF